MYVKDSRAKLLSLSKEQLVEWYEKEELSFVAIAKRLGVSSQSVSLRMKELEIPTRGVKEAFTLMPSYEEEQVILGTMLGDGTIARASEKGGVLSFMHSAAQKEYIEWKALQLQRFATPKGVKFDPMKSQDGKYHDTYVFWTRSSVYFSEVEKLYYPRVDGKRVKTITRDILDRIGPLGLSVWLMDDGNRYFNVITIPVPKSVKEVVSTWFKEKWYIGTGFNSLGPTKSVINVAFKYAEVAKLVDLVSEFIIPSMKYKIAISSAVR